MPETSSEPVRRADAERNRERILAAARATLEDRAGEASMASVARAAGVGMATLYRHFPGRRELLEGLYAREVDDLCRAADDAVEHAAGSAGEALESWLRRFAEFHQTKHPIAAELLRHTTRTDPMFSSSRERVLSAARPLVRAARQAHEVRPDLALEQMLDLVLAAAAVPGDPDYVAPILQAALDGLRR